MNGENEERHFQANNHQLKNTQRPMTISLSGSFLPHPKMEEFVLVDVADLSDFHTCFSKAEIAQDPKGKL